MTAGTITGNKATQGAGVYMASGAVFNLGGTAQIKGNTTSAGAAANIRIVSATGAINIISRLSDGAVFGVTRSAVGEITNGLSRTNPSAVPYETFVSETSAFTVIEWDTGTSKEAYMLATDNYTNWIYYLGIASTTNTQTFKLVSDWTAHSQTSTPNYRTSFDAVNTSHQADTDIFFYGALQIPANKSIIIDLNGYTLNRAMPSAYAYGNVIRVLGQLTIIDSSQSQTGKITGGFMANASRGSAIWHVSGSLTMTGGTITGNRSSVATASNAIWITAGSFTMTGGTITGNTGGNSAVYIAAGTTFNAGGSAKIYDNPGNLVFANNSLMVNVISPFKAGARIAVTRTTNNYTATEGTVFTSGYGLYNSDDPSKYFLNTSSYYKVINYGSGSGLEGAMWTIDNATNWQHALTASTATAPKTFILYSDWTALTDSTYVRTFGASGTTYTDVAGIYFYGALNVPTNKSIIINLNGYTIDRNLSSAYAYGYTLVNRGTTEIIDTSSARTGKITGAWCSGIAGGIYNVSGTLTVNGGTVTGNKATTGAGVYIAAGTLNIGGRVKITGNTNASGAARNIYLAGDRAKINIISRLTGGEKFGVAKSNTGNGTFTSGFAANNAGVAVADMFVSENATLRLMTDDDGEGYLLSTDNYTNWNYFLGLSTATNTQTVVLTSDWIAHTQTGSGHNYATSFGGQDVAYTADTDYYYYGALQVPANKSIILDLNGYKLSRNLAGGSSRSHGYVLRVLGELIIIDSSLAKSGEITGGYSITASTGGAIWQVSGSLTVRAGTITGNHTTVASAGAVWVTAGTFTMTGGAITANTCAANGLSAGLYVASGGTVNVGNSVRICDNAQKDVVFANTSKMINVVQPLVRGAKIGVVRDNNNFTQTDGARFTEGYGQYNTDDVTNYFYASNSSSYKVITYGSGTDTEAATWCINNFTNWQRAVDASSATVTQTFILYSDWTAAPCSSSYNYQTSFGTIGTQYTATGGNIYYGALQVPSGRSVQIDLNGFTINRALTSAYAQGYVIVNRGNLTITDSSKKQTGKITGGFSSGTAMAGGVWSAAGSLTLLSGSITGNKAPNGGGVYVAAGAFNLGGNIKVNGNSNSAGAARNIWLYATGVINVTSRLANGATYGITRNGVGIFTNGFSANNPGVESPDVFFSENAAYFVYDDETTENVESGMMANNPTLNWQFFVNASLKNKGKTYTVTLGDNWIAAAQTSSPNYRTTFGNKGTYYTDANGAYFYGAIQVPAGASMILDLNGHTINRSLSASYNYGYVIINRGTLTIIDSSEEQTGEIRGGWYNNNGAGIYNMGNLYLQAGKVTGNNGYGVHVYSGTVEMTGGFVTGNTNYGVYVNSSASLKLGGSAKVYNGGTVNTSYPEGNLNVGFASASSLISITSRFEEGARIGVTRDNNNFTSTLGSKFTSGYPNYNSQPVTKYFFASDTLRYRVQEYGDSGEAAMWCIDNYTNWQRAVAASSNAAPKTFIMYSDWNAQPCSSSYNYQTSFGAIGTNYNSTSGYFFYGALQVPSGKNVIIDLNGHTINRALGVSYSYGYVIMIRGSLTITDSSENQTGTITGGWNSGGAGSVYLTTGNLTITGGTITGNKATAGAGVYVAAGTLSLGGNPKIYGNTTAAGVDCNIYIPANNVIKIISPLTGDSKYGITRNGNGVFTSGLSKYNSGAPEDYFVSESISFEVIEEVNGDIVEASMLSTVPTTNWTYFVNKSLADGKTYTVKLRDDWIAKAQSSPNYRTAFITGSYTYVTQPYFRGSLQVPAGAKIILDLNGFTLSRNLTAGYSYGYNIIVRGELTIIDSSASQSGKITMGYCSSTGAGGVYVNGGKLTVLGGSITGNKGAKAGGVYVTTATGITVGGAAKIYDNTVNATTNQSNIVLLNAASVVNVNCAFDAAAYTEDGTVTPKIGVTKSVNNTSSASVNLVTKGYGQYNSVTPANYFFADDADNFMVSDYKENTTDWEGMMLNLNPANNWVNAINASLSNGSTQTVKLYKDWDAGTSSNYTTTFGTNSNTNHYRYGALYVPNGAKIILDLNGHSVNRNLKTARANGYVIIVYGTLTIIDSSANGDGKITGGKCNSIAGGVYLYQGSFTMTGGEITDNVATNGAGVYVRSGSFSLGGSTRIYDNKNAASEQKNIYLPNSGVINIVSELTGGRKLGVSRNAVGVFTKNYGKYHTTSPTNYFTSEYLDAAKGQGFRVVNFGTGTNLEGSMLGFNLIDNWNYAVTASITYEEAQTFDLFTNWTAATNSTYKTAFGTLAASYKTGGLYVPKGANVILNLNGHTLNRNNTSRYAIYVEGTLTIIDVDDDGNPLSSGVITGGNYGIYVMNGGTVNMQSGTVRGNSVYGVFDDSGAGFGGGFNMTGGAVTANTTYGVYESTGTFTMTGGSVYGNGKVGVYVGEKGKLALGGKAVISTAGSSAGTNLYFEDTSSVIDIVSAFGTGADISFLRTGLGKLTDGWTAFNASADFNDFLTSENASYNMVLKDGEIYITSEDGAVNWQHAVDTSLKTNDFETCILYSKWTADDNSDYTTAFGLTSAFVNGALYVPVGAKVILDLSGFELDRNLTTARSAGYVIYVAGELRIIDSTGNMSSVTGGRNSSSSSGGGIYVYNGGECTLNGITVKGNYANDGTSSARGGGVYVAGTLNIENSLIKQNNGYSAGGVYVSSTGTVNFISGSIEANVGETSSGGGVYTAGKFNMSGGTVTHNRGSAGGVFVANGGTFTLTDGSVTDNNGTGGGGVFVYSSASSKFIMQGGAVSGNTGTSAGGVYVAGVAEISGGSITGNVADATGGNENTSGGGGVYVANSGEATITGGEITGNVGVNGVRVYSSGVLNLGGSAKIHDNRIAAAADSDISDVFLTTPTAKYINIVSEFSGAEIGVSRTTAGKFTSGYGTYNTEHPKTYFYSNDNKFAISMTKPANEDDVAEAAIGTPINDPPEAAAEKTYNGEQQVIITGYDSTIMTVELPDGVEVQGTDIVAVNAGDYNISFTPAAGYCWEDGTVDALVVSAKILQATVTISWTDLEFTYNGTPKKPTATVSGPEWVLKDTFALTVNGEATDANLDGEHYIAEVVNLGNLNYTVEGSTNVTKDYVINRADIDTSKLILGKDEAPRYNNRFAPSITNNPSDGEITYSLTSGADNAQVGEDGKYILPTRIGGSITVQADIAQSRNYNAASVSGTFEIEKGIIALVIDDIEYARTGKLSIKDYNADEMGAVAFKNLSGDGIALLLDADGNIRITSVGTFVVTVSVTETDYYEGVTDGEIEFKIVPRLVTIQWGDTELEYTGDEQAPSVSITDGVLDGDTCTIIDVKGKGKVLGDYTASLDDGCLSNGNYTVGESCEMPFTIVQATLNISFKDEVQAKYKTELRLDANSINGNEGGGAVSYAKPDGSTYSLEEKFDEDGTTKYFVLIPDALGTIDIIVIVEEMENYKRAEVTLQLTVEKASVPVELKKSAVIYDATIQLEIKDYGENGTVKFEMEGSPSFATISESGLVSATGIGKFTLTITVGATDNFAETTVEGVEVEILPRPVVLKWTLAEKYVFNGKEQYPDVVVENLVGSDKCEVTVKGATDVGDHTAEAVGLSNPNYTLTDGVNRTQGFTIDKATLTITLGSEDIYYNTKFYPDLVGYLPDGKITYTVTNGGGEADVHTDDEGKDYILPTKTGKITLTVNVEGTGNYYAVENLQFELDVQKGYVPVELVENTTVYGTNLTLALKEYFILPEDEGAVTYAIAAEGSATGRAGIAEGSNILVPTQAGVVYLTITVAETANYYYTEATKVPVTISPLAVTVNWTQTEFIYDGNSHTPTAEITNLVNSYDYYDLTIDSPRIDAGTYEVEIVSIGNPNYTIEGASVKSELIIKPRIAELDWVIGEYTYNGDEQAPEAFVTNLVTNKGTGVLDECKVSVLGTKNAGDKLGAMAVGLSNKNYTLDGAEDTVADYKIAPLQIKIEWIGEYLFTYDGEEHAPEAKALGLFGGDNCEVIITGKQTNVGKYTAVAYDLSNSNYSISELTYEERTAEFEIERAILEIELGTTSVYYATPTKLEVISEVTLGAGSIKYTLEAGTTIATIVGGDTIMGTEIGRVKVTATAPETANYSAATAEGYIDIIPRVIEVVWSDTEFEYDGLYHIPTATIANLYADDDIEFTVSTAQKDAAEYTATVTLEKEYEKYTLEGSEFEIKFVINPRVIEIEWAGVEFDDEGEDDDVTLISSVVNLVYNGKYQAPDYIITNLVKQYNDDGSEIKDEDGNPVYEDCGVKIVGGSGADDGERNVGTNLTATVGGLLNSNYTLDGAGNLTTTFNITARVAEIIWDKSYLTSNGREQVPTLKYSGEEQAPSATIGNLCEGDVCELTINGKQAEVSPNPEYAKDEDGEDIYLGYTAIVAALSNSNYTLVGCATPSTDYRIIPAEMPVDLSVKVVEYGEELLLDVTGNLENGEIEFDLELGTGNAKIEDGTLIPLNAGTVTVVINVGATENYVETTKKVEVIIVPKLVTLDWEYLEFTYNGTERKPEAKINNLIVKDIDEEGNETYEECSVTAVQGATDAGTWTAYATALDNPNYTVYEYDENGQLVTDEDGKPVNLCYVEFTIVPAVVVIEWGETELKFTGSEQAPDATAIEDTDGNAIIGECLVTVTGGQTAVGSYTATAFSLSNPNYTLDGAANTTTKFSIVKSKPDIRLENTLATFGETFEIKITGNIGGGEVTYDLRNGTGSAVLFGDGLIPTHVGEVTLIVSVGETLNTEEITKEFTITIQKGTLPINLVKEEVVYGNSLNLAVQYCPDDGSVSFAPGDGSNLEGYDEAALGLADITGGVLTALKVGVVYVLVTATETENYVATSATVKVIIKQRVVELDWTVGDYTYDGTTHTPVAVVKNIVAGDDCTVTVQGAVNAGDQTVTATELDNDNYTLDGCKNAEITVNIKPRTVEFDWENLTLEYTGKAQVPIAKITNLVSYVDEEGNTVTDECAVNVIALNPDDLTDTEYEAIAVGEYTAFAFGVDNTNYTLDGIAEDKLKTLFNIEKAQLVLKVQPETLTYGVRTKLVLTYLSDGEYVEYTGGDYSFILSATSLAVLDGDGLTIDPVGIGTITLTVNLVETDCYKADTTTTFTVEIQKAPISVELPEASTEIVYGTELLLSVLGNTGLGEVTYTIDETRGKGAAFTIEERDGEYFLVAKHGKEYDGKHVGTVYITVDVAETSLYQSSNSTVQVEVMQLTVVLGWYDTELTYNGERQAPTAKVENLIDGDTCDVYISESSYKTNASSGNLAYAERLSNSDYSLEGVNKEIVFEIGKKPVTLTLLTTTAYFEVPVLLEVDGNEAGVEIQFGITNGTGAGTLDVREDGVYLNPTKLGTVMITATVEETANYQGATVKGLVVIEKNKMPIELKVTETVYGDDLLLEYEGVIEPTSISVAVTDNTGSAYISGSYLVPKKAGKVILTITTSETANYQSTMVTVTVTIKPRVIDLEWDNLTFTYDGFEHAPTATPVELLGNDECEIIVVGGKINAGTYPAGTAWAVAVTNSNYTVAENAYAPEFKINKARPPLAIATTTVTINVPTKLTVSGNYGKGNVTFMLENEEDGTVMGIISGDMFTGLVLGQVFVTALVEETENYTAGTASALITIEKPAVEFVLKENTVTYGEELELELVFKDGYTDEGGERTIDIDTENSTGEAQITVTPEGKFVLAALGAGSVRVIVTIQETLTYKTTVKEFDITITPNELSIVWEYADEPFVYNGKEQAPTAKVVGLPEGVECEVTVKGNIDAGTGLTATATELSNKNYAIAADAQVVSDAYVIAPRAVVIVWTDTLLAYNGEEQKPTATISNLVKYTDEDGNELSDECEITVNVLEGSAVIVGTYHAEVSEGEAFNPNYTLVCGIDLNSEFEISVRKVGINWVETGLTYNGEEQTPEAQLIDSVSGEVIEDESCEIIMSGAEIHAGTGYTATVAGLSNTNYSLDGEYSTTFTINAAKLQLDIGSLQLAYNGKAQAPEVNPQLIKEDDDVTIVFTPSDCVQIDEYTVTLSLEGNSASDYYLEETQITFNIVKADITVTVSSVNKLLDSVDEAATITDWYKLIIEGLTDADAASAIKEIFEDTDNFTFTPKFLLDGNEVAVGDLQEDVNYLIIPVVTGSSTSENYEVNIVVSDKYGILRIGQASFLQLKEDSGYQFLLERKEEGGTFRRTYAELGWTHGVDDLEVETFVLGLVLPNTTVNEFLENILDTSKLKLYDNKGTLLYDCGTVALGISAADFDSSYEYTVGTGWRIEYDGIDIIYISVLGDINGDGMLSAYDGSVIVTCIEKGITLDDVFVRLAAYVVNDGVLTYHDANVIYNVIRRLDNLTDYIEIPQSTEDDPE